MKLISEDTRLIFVKCDISDLVIWHPRGIRLQQVVLMLDSLLLLEVKKSTSGVLLEGKKSTYWLLLEVQKSTHWLLLEVKKSTYWLLLRC